jgi:signal transduction histidine kinase
VAELVRHLQTSIELERTAIAREIHDDVGGSLTALKFDLAWIERRVRDPELTQRVQSAQDVLAHALEASQRIMHNLRPAVLDQGLAAALQWLCENFTRRTGVLSAFHSSPAQLPELPSGVPLVVYRTAQEALTNVGKHAQARHVRVDLALSHGVLSLEVADDGCGIAEGDLAKARSFGIRGLHERAATVGGWIELGSSTVGTTLILSVPLDDRAAGSSGPSVSDWG